MKIRSILVVLLVLLIGVPTLALANSNGLRIRAVDPLDQPDSFRVVVEADASIEAGFGATPAASSFGIELADGKASIQRVRRLADLQVGTHTTVAIDHSLSFRKFEPGTDAILTHLAERMGPNDSYSLLLFGYEKTEYPVRASASEFVADLAAARSVTWDRHTRLLAHLEDAIRHAGREKPDGYRQVLLVTDGDEESNAYDKGQIIKLAQSLGVRVQTLIFKPSQAQGKGKLTGIDNLRVVSRQTGGDPFEYPRSSVSDSATAKMLTELDAWLDGTGRMLAIEASFRCMTRSSLENTIRVESPGGSARKAWSENYAFLESPSEALYAPCDGGKPLDCPAWQTADASNESCVAKPCGQDADCAPGTCDSGVGLCQAPGGSGGAIPDWLWWVLAATISLLVLLLVGLILMGGKKKEEEPLASSVAPPVEPLPAPEPEIVQPAPVSSVPTPSAEAAEALPDLPEVHLRVSTGEYRGRKYRLFKKTVRVGGDPKIADNDHTFDISTVSGQHAEFQTFPSGDLWVKDLGSSNGTTVNGQRVTAGQKMKINSGDQIGLGPDLLFVVERPSEALLEPSAVSPPGAGSDGNSPRPPARESGRSEVESPVDTARLRANRKKTIIE